MCFYCNALVHQFVWNKSDNFFEERILSNKFGLDWISNVLESNLFVLQFLVDLVCKHRVLIFVVYVLGVIILLKKDNSLCILLGFIRVHLEYDRMFVLQSGDDCILFLRWNRVVLLTCSLHCLLVHAVWLLRLLLLSVVSNLECLWFLVRHLFPNRLLLWYCGVD